MNPRAAHGPATQTHEIVPTNRTGRPDPARTRRWGDRRQELRFEIVGDVWASLEVRPAFRLVNVGEGGALIELPFPLPAGCRCSISLTAGDAAARVTAIVRHISPSAGRNGSCRIGIEFENVDPEARDQLGALLRKAAGSPPKVTR